MKPENRENADIAIKNHKSRLRQTKLEEAQRDYEERMHEKPRAGREAGPSFEGEEVVAGSKLPDRKKEKEGASKSQRKEPRHSRRTPAPDNVQKGGRPVSSGTEGNVSRGNTRYTALESAQRDFVERMRTRPERGKDEEGQGYSPPVLPESRNQEVPKGHGRSDRGQAQDHSPIKSVHGASGQDQRHHGNRDNWDRTTQETVRQTDTAGDEQRERIREAAAGISREMVIAHKRKRRRQTNAKAKILKSGTITLQNMKQMADQTTADNEAAAGARFMHENMVPFAATGISAGRRSSAAVMKAELDREEKECFRSLFGSLLAADKKLGAGILTKGQDIRDYSSGEILAVCRNYLEYNKVLRIGTRDPASMVMQIKRAGLSGRLPTKDLQDAARIAVKAGNIEAAKGRRKYTLVSFFRRKTAKYMRQDETARVLVSSYRYGMMVRKFVYWHVKAQAIALRAGSYSIKKTSLFAARKTLQLARTQLVQSITPAPVKNAASAVSVVTTKTGRNIKAIKRKAGRTGGFLKESRRRILAPFWIFYIRARQIATLPFRGRYNPLGWIAGGIGHLFTFSSKLRKAALAVAAAAVVLWAVLFVILIGLPSILAGYDFVGFEPDMQDIALQEIQACYSQQVTMCASYDELETVDKKSNEAYTDGDLDYTETTNITEMLAMATVYFEGEYEDKDPVSIKNYIRRVYYGSHVFFVESDGEDGHSKATLTTYYFDDIFDHADGQGFFASFPMEDDTGELVQTTIRVRRMDDPSEVKVSAFGDPSIDKWNPSNTGRYSGKDCIPYYSIAIDPGSAFTKNHGLHGGSKVILDMPSFAKVSGPAMVRVDDSGSFGSSRFNSRHFDLFIGKDAAAMDKWGEQHLAWYLPDDNGIEMTVWTRGSAANNASTKANEEKAERFLSYMESISQKVKAKAAKGSATDISVKSKDSCDSYDKFLKKISGTGTLAVNSTGPAAWALHEMGYWESDSAVLYRSKDGSLMGAASALSKKKGAVRVIKDGIDKKSPEDAAQKGLLQPGDIVLGIKGGKPCGFVVSRVSSGDLYVYTGGGAASAEAFSNGIGPYRSDEDGMTIKVVLRWK